MFGKSSAKFKCRLCFVKAIDKQDGFQFRLIILVVHHILEMSGDRIICTKQCAFVVSSCWVSLLKPYSLINNYFRYVFIFHT